MKCMKGRCTNAPGKVKGYSQFSSVKESVSAYVTNLNTHPAYSSFRKSRAQLRKADQGSDCHSDDSQAEGLLDQREEL